MANPVINPDAGLSPVEGGYIAYDPVRDRVHEMNALGALLAVIVVARGTADAGSRPGSGKDSAGPGL